MVERCGWRRTEPAEEGDPLQTSLCGDTGVFWEEVAEHEDVEFAGIIGQQRFNKKMPLNGLLDVVSDLLLYLVHPYKGKPPLSIFACFLINLTSKEKFHLRLMIPNNNRGPRLPQIILGILDIKPHPQSEPHGPLERARDSPLPQAALAHNTEEQGREHAVAGAGAHITHGSRGVAVIR